MHDAAITIALVGILIFAAHLFEALFRQTRIPDVLPLVLIGFIIGPLLGIASPTQFGVVGPVFIAVTFILILFEAGTGLSISSLRNTYKETFALSTITFAITVGLVGAAGIFLTELGIIRSFILAFAVGALSSAIIVPMLSQLNMQADGKAVLLLESSISDVIAVIATLSLIEIARMGDIAKFDVGITAGKLLASFILAAALGIGSAFVWSIILNRIRSLQNSIFTTAAFVFVIFGLAEWLGYGGAIAALAFGITLGNISYVHLPKLLGNSHTVLNELNIMEKAFFSEMVFILKTFFFVYMGISLQFADWWLVVIGLIMTIIIYVVRLPLVRFLVAKSTPKLDASMLAVVIPRGLASAVLASIPFQQDLNGGETIQNIAYAIILISIVLTSLLVFLIDKTKFSGFYSWFFSNLHKKPETSD